MKQITLTSGIFYTDKRFVLVNNLLDTDGKYVIDIPDGTNNFENDISSTLSASISSADTTLSLTDATNFATSGAVIIDSEIIFYTGKSSNDLTGCTRGNLGTTATAHTSSATVLQLQQRSGFKSDDTTSHTFTYNGGSIESYNENPSTDEEYGTWFNSYNFYTGIKITKSVITANDDESLLDPSVGIPNQNAPGADRLQIILTLDIRPWNQEYSDFVPLIKVKNGIVVERINEPQYSEILRYFARVLDETQGSYTVKNHNLSVGEWTSREISANSDRDDTFALTVGPGLTYVNGYRREKIAPEKYILDKGYSNISDNFSGQGILYKAYNYFDVRITSGSTIQLDKIFKYTDSNTSTEYHAWVREVQTVTPASKIYRIYYSDPEAGFEFNIGDGTSAYTVEFYDSTDYLSLGSSVATGTVDSAISFTDEKKMIYKTKQNAVNISDLTLYSKMYQSSLITGGGAIGATATLDNYYASEVDPTDSSNYTLVNSQPSAKAFVVDATTGGVKQTGFTLNISGGGVNQITWSTEAPPANDYYVYYGAYGSGTDKTGLETTELRNTNTSVTQSFTASSAKAGENVDQLLGNAASYFDVHTINSVTNTTNGTVYTKDVDYKLLSGQTAEYFYASAIRWLKNKNRPTAGQSVTIDFDYWSHQGTTASSANGSIITADSFKDSTGTTSDYLNISKYLGVLRSDIIDFRTRNESVSIVDDSYTFGNNYQNTYDIAKRTRRPLSDQNWSYDVQWYLPRYVTVYLDKDGKLTLLDGEARNNPVKPKNPPNSLLLANIYMPSYPRSGLEVKITPWKSKRFNQQDIRRIEERVTNLETFVLNNKLELLAIQQELDPSDTRRGVMVDNFEGHGIADVNNVDYNAAIDPIEQALRLPFSHEFFDISFDISNFETIGSNMKVNDKTITLDFVESAYISQLKASTTRNVNPYDAFDWVGNLKLTPAVDVWVDTNGQPQVVDNADMKNANFQADRVGWEREFNFWNTRILGIDASDNQTNRRFEVSENPLTDTDSNIVGGVDQSDSNVQVEREIAQSDVAWSSRLDGFTGTPS